MTNSELPSIDRSDLNTVHGGASLKPIVEGGRKLLQVGAVAWNTLFPTHAPIKPPPTPPRIERVRPNPQTIGGSPKGGE
jgi:hypothetical protein